MTTLKEARENGEIAKFAKEHRRDPKGDAATFNRTLEAMAGTLTIIQATSDEALSDD